MKRDRAPKEPALPAWKAFVVQFSRESEPDTKAFARRVEHLSSDRRERFESREQLVPTLTRLLRKLGKPTG